MNYYNEHDPKAAAWLRELIAQGHIAHGVVDERSIEDVKPNELTEFTQCHFFAGIGGWSLALRLAGWPDDKPVWTGSCPCQPFSVAGKGAGTADERHLWPAFKWLIDQCRPATVFGEQVASKAGREWLAGVFADLEGMAYQRAGADLCAAGIGRPHARQRLWWFAHSSVHGCEGLQRGVAPQIPENRTPQALAPWDIAGDSFTNWKELLAGTGVRRLDDGVSSGLVVRPALRGFGNAIVPQVAAEFIQACNEALVEKEEADFWG